MNREAAAPRLRDSSTAVTLVVAACWFVLFLDGAIISTSLPQMARDLRVSVVDMNLGVTAYLLAVAVFTPLSAWLADRLGAKAVFVSAIALFTAASFGCSVANSLPLFVAARIAQGVGGAVLMPVGRALILRNTKPSELMQAMALLAWPALFAPVIGPVIGGAITSTVGWRWNFLLNLPLGLIGLALAAAIVPRSGERVSKPLDVTGALLTGGALFLLVYSLGRFGDHGGLAQSGGMLLAGAILAVCAIEWLRRAKHPLLDLSTLKVPTFAMTTVEGGSLCLIAISATPFMLPLMMQTAWGFGPLAAGGWLLIYFLGNLLMKSRTTAVMRTWGFRRVMVTSGLLIGASVAACGFLQPSTPHLIIGFTLFVAGATRSMQMTALGTLSFADVPGERRGSASTLSSMLQQLCMATGVAVAALILNFAKSAHGTGSLHQGDFQIAFLVCGLIGAAGGLLCLRLHPEAGVEVSGHRRVEAAASAAAAPKR